MITNVRARYANGVLTPLEPLGLEEGAEVMVSITETPQGTEGERQSANAVSQSIEARGKSIYEGKILQEVDETDKGKFAVIDVYSGDYEIDFSDAAAIRRLLERHPGAVTYIVRIGHPTAYKTGFRARVPNA